MRMLAQTQAGQRQTGQRQAAKLPWTSAQTADHSNDYVPLDHNYLRKCLSSLVVLVLEAGILQRFLLKRNRCDKRGVTVA